MDADTLQILVDTRDAATRASEGVERLETTLGGVMGELGTCRGKIDKLDHRVTVLETCASQKGLKWQAWAAIVVAAGTVIGGLIAALT